MSAVLISHVGNLYLQQMENITENHNQSKYKVLEAITADESTIQPWHLRLKDYGKRSDGKTVIPEK